MVKVAKCDGCGKEDLTGYIACIRVQLCPQCAAKLLNCTKAEARKSLGDKQKEEGNGHKD